MKTQLIQALFIVAALGCEGAYAQHHHDHSAAEPDKTTEEVVAPLAGDSLYNSSANFIDQDGKAVKLDSLRGHPVVISMAYTGCVYTCPMILSQMQQVEEALAKSGRTDVQFVLVSFDFQKDKPDVLKAYAKKRGLSKNWKLLTASSDKEPREVSNLLGIKYKKMEGGDYDHSFIISVLDAEGVIKGRKVGAGGDIQALVGYLPK